jgi:hypothetical protein
MNKKLNFRSKKCLFFAAALSYFFLEACHSLPKPPVFSKKAESVKIIEFNPGLAPDRFEKLGQSECNLQDIAAPLREAQELCLARFKNEAAEKGAHYVMVSANESRPTYSNTTVNGERYISKLDMTGYFIKDKNP